MKSKCLWCCLCLGKIINWACFGSLNLVLTRVSEACVCVCEAVCVSETGIAWPWAFGQIAIGWFVCECQVSSEHQTMTFWDEGKSQKMTLCWMFSVIANENWIEGKNKSRKQNGLPILLFDLSGRQDWNLEALPSPQTYNPWRKYFSYQKCKQHRSPSLNI